MPISVWLATALALVLGSDAKGSTTALQEFRPLKQDVERSQMMVQMTGGECGAGWTSGDYSLQRNGISRKFRVRLPSDYEPLNARPLVLVFHGWGGDEGEFLNDATVAREADERGYVIAAPLGLGEEEPGNYYASWSFSGSTSGLDGTVTQGNICNDDLTTDYAYPSCAGIAQNGCSWTQCTDDDVAFAVDLVTALSQNLCIDPERVYAVGGSNGGMFVWDLARHDASARIFSGIASLIGMPHRGYLSPPVSASAMPAILITGMNDPTSPPGSWDQTTFTTSTDGDHYYYTGAAAITEVWARAHYCDTDSPATPFDTGISEAECRGWNACRGQTSWPPVLDCRHDIGHRYGLSWSWPLILDFFEKSRDDSDSGDTLPTGLPIWMLYQATQSGPASNGQ